MNADTITTINHYMSPTLTFIVLACGGLLDWFGVGPDSWRDRVAAMCYLAGLREGWNGGALDSWLVARCSWAIDVAKDTGNAYIKDGDTALILGGLLALLTVYLVCAWLPNWKWVISWAGKLLGPVAKVQLPKSPAGRINFKMLGMVVPIALMADLIPGRMGTFISWGMDNDCKLLDFCFGWAF
jgi:hypothetical protein